jgi:hypothetical protein
MHGTAVHQPDGDDAYLHDLIRAVEGGAEEVLLLAVRVVTHERQQIGGGRDLHPVGLDAAAGEFDGGEQQCRLGVPHALELGQVVGRQRQALLVDHSGQLTGQRHDVHAGCALAQHNGEQLLIAERSGALGKELLARSILLRDLVHRSAHGAQATLTS